MIQIYNGYRCSKCNSIYLNQENAIKCEGKEMEQPLIAVGQKLIDTYEEAEFLVGLSKISYEEHKVCYTFESEDEDGEWTTSHTVFGNHNLLSEFGDQIK